MQPLELFIRSKEEFIQAKEMVSTVFDLEQRLPQQVFRSDYANFHFDEFDWAWSRVERYRDFADPGRLFWDNIKEVSAITKDDFVIIGMCELGETDAFYRELGYYNWLKVPVDIDYDEVLDMLRSGAEVEERWGDVLYSRGCVAWVGSSRQWGIWGEMTEEMCVFGLREDVDAESISPIVKDWLPPELALPDWINLTLDESVKRRAASFKQELIKNYSK